MEIATYRALVATDAEFYGRFRDLQHHDDSQLYSKEEPPQHIGKRSLNGDERLDFLLRNNDARWMGLECKNVREWLYPDRTELIETLRKCIALQAVPHRRSKNSVRLLPPTLAMRRRVPPDVQSALPSKRAGVGRPSKE